MRRVNMARVNFNSWHSASSTSMQLFTSTYICIKDDIGQVAQENEEKAVSVDLIKEAVGGEVEANEDVAKEEKRGRMLQ